MSGIFPIPSEPQKIGHYLISSSGMQEDLRMFGNEYTYAVRRPLLHPSHPGPSNSAVQQTAYTVAYAIMQIPSTLIIQKVRPRYWLAAMEVGWGVFTFAQARMSNVQQLYAFRFLVGLFESSFFPCMLYVLGSWYVLYLLSECDGMAYSDRVG